MASFQFADLGTVGVLVILEGLLSADNALVLALLVRHLPRKQQKRALLYGLCGAFVLRGLGIYFARRLMALWWVCALGAAYLMFLSARHFWSRNEGNEKDKAKKTDSSRLGFWPTVALVEATDVVFAIDSILVAVALVRDPTKIWVVYAGGFIGIILLRLAATFFIRLMEKFPALDHLAYALVGWAGVKLASTALDIFREGMGRDKVQLLPSWAFWVGFAVIVGVGTWYAARHRAAKPEDAAQDRADLRRLRRGGFLMNPPPGPRSLRTRPHPRRKP